MIMKCEVNPSKKEKKKEGEHMGKGRKRKNIS